MKTISAGPDGNHPPGDRRILPKQEASEQVRGGYAEYAIVEPEEKAVVMPDEIETVEPDEKAIVKRGRPKKGN